MENANIVLERHEQRLIALERNVSDLQAVQVEIKEMNKTLVMLANELKHTNEHLERHERKLEIIDAQPKQRLRQIVTAVIAMLAGGLISTMIGKLFAG